MKLKTIVNLGVAFLALVANQTYAQNIHSITHEKNGEEYKIEKYFYDNSDQHSNKEVYEKGDDGWKLMAEANYPENYSINTYYYEYYEGESIEHASNKYKYDYFDKLLYHYYSEPEYGRHSNHN